MSEETDSDLVADNEVIAHNEPMVYEVEDEDGVEWTIYRISSTGRCLLELVAAKTGWPAADPPPVISAAFNRGHLAEKAILDRYMKEHGVGLDMRQAQVEYVIAPGVKLRGHIDARNIGSGNVVDSKFYRTDQVDKILRDPDKYMPRDYLFQAAGYGASLGNVGMEFVFGRRNIDKNPNPDAIVLEGIEVIEYSWEELKPWLGKARVKIAKAERIAREDLEFPLCEDAKRWPCPFHELRRKSDGTIEATNATDPARTFTFDSSDTAGLAETLWKEREEQAQIEANAKKGKDELNLRIEALMQQEAGDADETQTWDVNGIKVLRVRKDNVQYDWVKLAKAVESAGGLDAFKKPPVPVRYLQRGKGSV